MPASTNHKQNHALTHIVALHRSCLPNLRRWLITVECNNWVVRQHNLQGHHCRSVPIAANSSRWSSFKSRALHLWGCPTGCRCPPPPSMGTSERCWKTLLLWPLLFCFHCHCQAMQPLPSLAWTVPILWSSAMTYWHKVVQCNFMKQCNDYWLSTNFMKHCNDILT